MVSGARPVSVAFLSGCASVQIAPDWSVTFTLVLIVLPRNWPLLIFPDTVAMSEPPDDETLVASFAVDVFVVFHVIVTVVVAALGSEANVAQFCAFVPLVE